MIDLTKAETVFFDMGNTLMDFHKGMTDDEKDFIGLKNMSDYLNEKYNLNMETDKLKTGFLDKWYGDFHIRTDQLKEINPLDYLNDFLTDHNLKLTEVEGINIFRCFYKEYMKQIVVNNGAYELLSKLKDINKKVGVISNCILHEQLYKEVFREVGLDQFVDEYIFSFSLKVRKPRIEIFKTALERLNANPKTSIMIGDGLKADIYGAEQLGMKTIWYNCKLKENKTDIMPDFEIQSFKDLIEYI